jgi:hypothetical protein
MKIGKIIISTVLIRRRGAQRAAAGFIFFLGYGGHNPRQ